MDPFSYLSIVTSIVIALGITRILTGVGKLLERRASVKLYWVHLFWALNVFLFLVLQWWILFRWQSEQNWNFFLFLFLLLSPTVAFLMTVILFRDPFPETMDFKQHFYANRRWFFSLAALLPPLDAVDTLLKGYSHFVAQGAIYPVTLVVVSALNVFAAVRVNERFHKVFPLFFLAYLITFIAINLSTLS